MFFQNFGWRSIAGNQVYPLIPFRKLTAIEQDIINRVFLNPDSESVKSPEEQPAITHNQFRIYNSKLRIQI